MIKKNEQLRAIDREYLSWGDAVHDQEYPIIAAEAEGECIIDKEGHRYIDLQMWHCCCNFGYKNHEIQGALIRQLDNLPQISGDLLHEEKLLLAKVMVDTIYERTGLKGRVAFNVGGALAVEEAMKIIRKHTGKSKIAGHIGCYHGRSLSVSALSSGHQYRQGFGSFPDQAVLFPYANRADVHFDQGENLQGNACAKRIDKILNNPYYGLATDQDCAFGGFFLECCQGRGYYVPPQDFFKEFVPKLQKKGVLIVADEIQAGMFRSGKLFAFEHFDIKPDIITFGKSFTNGLTPLSAIWARDDLFSPEAFPPNSTYGTYANHILGTTAALSTWNYMLAQNYEKKISEKSAYYLQKLKALAKKYEFIYELDGLGMLLHMRFADQEGRPYKKLAAIATTLAQTQDYTYQERKYRLILSPGGYWGETLKFAPYLDCTFAEIDRAMALLDQVLAQLPLYIKEE